MSSNNRRYRCASTLDPWNGKVFADHHHIVKIYREGQPVIKERILHGFECPPEVKLKRQILLELAEAMHIPLETVRVRDHDDDDFSLWRNAAIPLPEQVGPIAGLRVTEEGFICTRCPTENLDNVWVPQLPVSASQPEGW